MAPRGSARRSGASANGPGAPAQSALPRCPAHIAFQIVEIRREILQLLPPADLARCMRVEKGCMQDVVRELHRSMRVENAEAIKSVDPSRKQMYTQAITEIDARSMAVLDLLPPEWHAMFDGITHLKHYNPLWFNFIVPYLREKYAGLRKIQFGHSSPRSSTGERLQSHTVTFDTALAENDPRGPSAYDPRTGYKGELGGDVQLFAAMRVVRFRGEPPIPLISPLRAPKGNYNFQQRINVYIGSEYTDARPSPQICERWRIAMRDSAVLNDLHSEIEIQHLPIPLDLLVHFYQRQLAAGHIERLEKIKAGYVIPWSVDDFARFANVASTLTCLQISGRDMSDVKPIMTFRDLSTFISLVRTNLPHLVTLTMDIDGIGDAEAVCKAQLNAQSIASGGTIKNLQIGTGLWDEEMVEVKAPLFNVLRMLSGLCAQGDGNCISVAVDEDEHPWGNDQTAYVQYLLRQSPKCRRHLSTADLPTMGLKHVRDVLLLDYDADGRPFMPEHDSEDEQEPTKWLAEFLEASQDTYDMEEEVTEFVELLQALEEISAGSTAKEKMRRAKKLLNVMVPLRAKYEKLCQSMDVEAVKNYIDSLGA